MKVKTLFALIELAGVCGLAGIAYRAINEEHKAKTELIFAGATLDLAGLAMELQKNEIEKLREEIKKLKGEA